MIRQGVETAPAGGAGGDEAARSWLDRLDDRLFTLLGADISIQDLLVFLLIVLTAVQVSRLLQGLVTRGAQARGIGDKGKIASFNRLIHYLVIPLGLGIGLQALGIDLTALFAAGALLAVAIGFGMQTISENFISGIILLVERSIKPGDVLEVDGRVVRVEHMGIRSTVARTRDEEELIVPNSSLVTSTVKNYTLGDSFYRLRITVGVLYSSDMEQVRLVLERTAEGLQWRARSHQPRILLIDFGDSAVEWEVSVWMSDPWQAPPFASRLREAVWFALKQEGITIAFPQLDVHFDPKVEQMAEALVAGR